MNLNHNPEHNENLLMAIVGVALTIIFLIYN